MFKIQMGSQFFKHHCISKLESTWRVTQIIKCTSLLSISWALLNRLRALLPSCWDRSLPRFLKIMFWSNSGICLLHGLQFHRWALSNWYFSSASLGYVYQGFTVATQTKVSPVCFCCGQGFLFEWFLWCSSLRRLQRRELSIERL